MSGVIFLKVNIVRLREHLFNVIIFLFAHKLNHKLADPDFPIGRHIFAEAANFR